MFNRLPLIGRRRPKPSLPERSPVAISLASGVPPFTFVAEADPPQDAAAMGLLKLLDDVFNGQSPPPIASPTMSLAEVEEVPVGLGNRRGIERLGFFSVAELKGLRLNALVRFQLRFDDPETAEQWLNDLNLVLLNNRDLLRRRGLLRMKLESAPPAEFVDGTWRIVAHFRMLYEHRYRDSGGAESLIVSIPINGRTDGEQLRETTVRDEIVRWDKEEAPALEVTGTAARRLGGLTVLAHLPDSWTGLQVTLAYVDLSSPDPPQNCVSLTDFLDAVAGNPAPQPSCVQFDSVQDLLDALQSPPPPFPTQFDLGDWDEDGQVDEYDLRLLPFGRPIELPRPTDALRLSYQEGRFDAASDAVVYIRAGRGILNVPLQEDPQNP